MKFFRHALFVVLLLLVQSGALTHAFEHQGVDADLPPGHRCSLCIAAHGLDTALALAPPAIVPATADFALPFGIVLVVASVAIVSPRARAPPAA